MNPLSVRGTLVAPRTLTEATNAVLSMRAAGGGFVCLANVHVVETARHTPALASALAEAKLVLPDGAPIAWTLRRMGARSARIAGSDLIDSVLKEGRKSNLRHFFLGSTERVLERLVEACLVRHPGLQIAGTHAPPFIEAEQMDVASIAGLVSAADADVVWVGLGAPKQEILMARLGPHIEAPLVGVGAVFDFVSGEKRRAPVAMQRAGLEWLHRLASEPKRLGLRYLTTNAAFVAAALRGRLHEGAQRG